MTSDTGTTDPLQSQGHRSSEGSSNWSQTRSSSGSAEVGPQLRAALSFLPCDPDTDPTLNSSTARSRELRLREVLCQCGSGLLVPGSDFSGESGALRRKKPEEPAGRGLPSAESREGREPFSAAVCVHESRTQSVRSVLGGGWGRPGPVS